MRSCRDRFTWLPLHGLLGSLLLMAASPAHATDRWFQLDRSPWFQGWRMQLQELVDQDRATGTSQVCAVGWQDGDPATLQAYIVWPAGHELITWRPSRDDPHSLVHETLVTDLHKDVVANEQAVNGSTYLVTRAWVRHIEQHCRSFGTTVSLSPRSEPSHG